MATAHIWLFFDSGRYGPCHFTRGEVYRMSAHALAYPILLALFAAVLYDVYNGVRVR
ncbi:MAG: hypothetical protein M3Z05_05505 [Gemmatimonadota bacterium]|nr:hypothetical protein [Gemmatimonadota bacterium]